ncbi:MAG: hypothetical protein ACYC7D_07435 [Nitrososphaerales archaeon]
MLSKKLVESLLNYAALKSTVAGVDLGDSTSLATVLSPSGDLMDRFTFQMKQEGYQILAERLRRMRR